MSTPGFFTLIFYLLLWTVIGFVYLLFIALSDVKELMSILYMHDGCKAEAGIYVNIEKEVDYEMLHKVYNDVRSIAWT